MNLQGYNGVMVLAEHKNNVIHNTTYELLNWGRNLADKLGCSLSCAVLGCNVEGLEELIVRGADRVLYVNDAALENFLSRPYTSALAGVVWDEKPEVVVAAATTTGRTIMPMVAARLDTGLTADCTVLDIEPGERILLQTRPAIGGNIMATIKTPVTRPQMATVRPKSVRQAPRDESRRGEIINKTIAPALLRTPEKFVRYVRDASQEVNIQDADIIVAGGKGLKNKAGFKLVEQLAETLGAGVGATRDAVDLGWVSYSHQIGLSGKTVSPKLYIAVGVSGKIQHLAGMQTAEYIVAINKDPEAQIFKVADLGILGEASEVVPALIEEIKKAGVNA
ncbi:MAG: electron transfer flavoprotein subunit alpha/FixB family protein [Firmicutes bacterium]|nr:electron transfer flavoprotein subunit alpha/FixB family protein [Bacillota bacterium]